MPITEAQAVEVARRFAEAKRRPAWRTVEVLSRRIVAGYDCWRVMARGSLSPGEPDWWGETDDWITYLVDVEEGVCVGAEVLAGDHLFVPARDR